MLREQASRTAQAVAAVRAATRRLPAPYGNPAADDRLQRSIAGSASAPVSSMARYLSARTTFVDRQVIAALDARVRQVVIAGAGYDGRALRYAKPGVRWFEVDHPATQADKLARLKALGAETEQVRFVAADFTSDDVAARLAVAGCDRAERSLVVLEGVAVYLDLAVLVTLLDALRRVTAAGSQLVITLSVVTGSPATDARREEFARRVAALGEPARTFLPAADAGHLLASTGWHINPPEDGLGGQRAWRAGFVTATAGDVGDAVG